MSVRIGSCILLITAILAFVLNEDELFSLISCNIETTRMWRGREFCTGGEYLDAPRQLLRSSFQKGDEVYLVTQRGNGTLTPVERSLQLSLAWEAMPDPVRFGSVDGAGGSNIVISESSDTKAGGILSDGYICAAQDGGRSLWLRRDAVAERKNPSDDHSAVPWWREGLGSLFVLAVLTAFFLRADGAHLSKMRPMAWWIVTAYAALLLILALAHTFMPPNGLGVYGGKARLLWICKGLPHGFWSDPAWSTYQPAYPPGLVFLALISYTVSGGCGEWLVQIVGTWGVVALFTLLIARCKTSLTMFWTLILFLIPSILRIGTQFYAEPFAVLCLLLGWDWIRNGRGLYAGWIVMGLGGLFRPEAVGAMPCAWIATRIFSGRSAAPFTGLMLGIAPSAVWIVFCLACGVSAPGLKELSDPVFGQSLAAVDSALDSMFVHAWRTGFVWWFAVGVTFIGVFQRFRGKPQSASVGMASALFAAAGMVVLACLSFAWRDEPGLEWLLRTSLPRLLWMPAMLCTREIIVGHSSSFPIPHPAMPCVHSNA